MTKNEHQPQQPTQSRCLWKDPSLSDDTTASRKKAQSDDVKEQEETYESILNQFCSQPSSSYQSFARLCSNTLVVGQEFALTCLFLARHRVLMWQEEGDENGNNNNNNNNNNTIDQSQFLAMLALVIIALYSNSSATPPQPQPRKAKIQQRSSDAILLAILLRLLAAVLRTLTASFSSDTVQSLTMGGMLVHWLSCDYSYANGSSSGSSSGSSYLESSSLDATANNEQSSHHPEESQKQPIHFLSSSSSRRPTFQGGTISLNAAFFSTTLLASRLSSNATVYVFVSSAIIIFAFYPAARHAISHHPHRTLVHSGVTLMLSLSTCLVLQDWTECLWFGSILLVINGIAPLWKWYLQRYKRKIDGPWDVVPVSQMKLDY